MRAVKGGQVRLAEKEKEQVCILSSLSKIFSYPECVPSVLAAMTSTGLLTE
jgi:hypothetical protein